MNYEEQPRNISCQKEMESPGVKSKAKLTLLSLITNQPLYLWFPNLTMQENNNGANMCGALDAS